MQGISLVLVTAFVVVNLLVDVLYAVLDPRVALGAGPSERGRCAQPAVARPVAAAPRPARPAAAARDRHRPGMASAAVIAVAHVRRGLRAARSRPYNPDLPNLSLAWVGPVGGHLLGFDFQGRDVLSRLLAGAQSSMLGPLAVVVVSMIAGSRARGRRGLAAGRGGRGDLLRSGHPVRVPRHPARGAGRGGVRRRPDRRRDRAVHRVHALRRPGAARRGAEGAQPALRRRAGGAGRLGHRDLPAAPRSRTCCR